MTGLFIIPIIVFLTVILLCISGYYFFRQIKGDEQQSKRIHLAVNTESYSATDIESGTGQKENLRRDTRISTIPWLEKLLSGFLKDRAKSLWILIEQSGLKIRVSEFLLFSVFIGLSGGLLVNALFQIPFLGLLLIFMPYFIIQFLIARRISTFVSQLPQALDVLSSDLRAGVDILTGIKHLSEEFPVPLGEEFGKVIVEVNLGLSITDALNNLAQRVNTMDVQILCTGIIINKELGGNLSELIGRIGATIRERFKLKGLVRALTAENQMSTILLMVLPVGLYIALNVLAPATYGTFASDPMGRMILTGCVISMGFGYMVIQKMTKLEV